MSSVFVICNRSPPGPRSPRCARPRTWRRRSWAPRRCGGRPAPGTPGTSPPRGCRTGTPDMINYKWWCKFAFSLLFSQTKTPLAARKWYSRLETHFADFLELWELVLVRSLQQSRAPGVEIIYFASIHVPTIDISKSRSSTSREKKFYHHFSIVKYSYLPKDTFKKYVEMHVTRSKLTLKFPGYCRH